MALRLSRILMGSQTFSLSLSLYSLRVVCAAAIIGLLILVIIKREGQGRGTEKINLIDPWLRKFLFEAPQSLNIDARHVPQMMRLPTLGLPPYRVFTLEEIDDATNNFDATNLMGEGSQGLVLTLNLCCLLALNALFDEANIIIHQLDVIISVQYIHYRSKKAGSKMVYRYK